MCLRDRCAIVTFAGCVLSAAAAGAESVTSVVANGPPSNRVDIVIVGDGYSATDINNGKYSADVAKMIAGLFAEQPYNEYQRFFNVHRIDLVSTESGADHPSRGVYRDTALGSAYDCSGIERLICVDLNAVSNVVGRSIADPNAQDIILVLVNDDQYGGQGGSIAVASTHSSAVELVLHEVGHSFALLADEYGGNSPPCSLTEPSSPNATMKITREAIKWTLWIDTATPIPTTDAMTAVPGLYEGARYCDSAMFRPTFNSKMRNLGMPFDQINVEAHVKRIYNYVSPIESASPAPGSLQVRRGETIPFSVTVMSPATHNLGVAWFVDGVRVGANRTFSFAASDFSQSHHTVTVTVADSTPFVRTDPSGVLGESATWSVDVVGDPVLLVPGTIQAEDFDNGGEGAAYHDETTGNSGGQYRTDTAVDLEATADAGGGYNVGWIAAGEWLTYTISVAENRAYTLSARVAAAGPGGTFHVEFNGVNKTGPLTIPDTGGWQSWTDLMVNVTLNAGVQSMRVVFDSSGPTAVVGNLNYLRLVQFTGSSASAPTPLGGTPWPLAGTIQAEDFDDGGEGVGFHDDSTGNSGGAYRNTDVDIEATADGGGGYDVGWMQAGEWLNYTVSISESRTYTLTARVAAAGSGGTFHLEFDGVNKTGPLTIPNTGGWQSWADVTTTIALSAGVRRMRVVADSNGSPGVFGNLNYFRFVAAGGPRSTSFGGAPRLAPGTIQAEDFDDGGENIGYHDASTGNSGGEYRPGSDVDIERTTDTGGGYCVGWIGPGEWLAYTISIAENRAYTLTARVAADGPGGTFHIEFDGVNKTGPLTIPNTGGWQSWTDLTVNVNLNSGVQVMRVVIDGGGATGVVGNLNYVALR